MTCYFSKTWFRHINIQVCRSKYYFPLLFSQETSAFFKNQRKKHYIKYEALLYARRQEPNAFNTTKLYTISLLPMLLLYTADMQDVVKSSTNFGIFSAARTNLNLFWSLIHCMMHLRQVPVVFFYFQNYLRSSQLAN